MIFRKDLASPNNLQELKFALLKMFVRKVYNLHLVVRSVDFEKCNLDWDVIPEYLMYLNESYELLKKLCELTGTKAYFDFDGDFVEADFK
jgi:hypothetical protein